MFQNFLNELKRRRVVRISGVYAVTCWGLFQIVNALFPALRLPAWSVTLVAVLLMLGFPLTLVVAWAFEKGPDGPRLTEAAKDPKATRFKWTDAVFAIAAVAIVGVTLAQMSGIGAHRRPAAEKVVVLAPGVPAKSVAVLPFVNFSQQQDAGFFADGLTEEVINSLAQIPDLKVAGRTSAFYFKGKSEDLREIGRKLGVAHVVEGSVQRNGDKLRVTAQLISVADGFHVWSKTYDRDMNDAFAIQTEIANAVAEALKTKLMAVGTAAPKARDPELYRQELVAKAQLRSLGLNELTAARETYHKLMAAEPDNAEVFAGYAFATATLAQNYLTIDFNTAEKEARAAIGRALALNPRSASAYVAKGVLCQVLFIRTTRQACIQEIDEAYRKALEIEPRNPEVMTFYGIFRSRSDPAGAIPYLKRALELDPLNRIARNGLAGAYEATGQFPLAERQYKSTIEAYPDFVDAKQELGELYVEQGRLDLARPWIKLAAAPATDPSSAVYLALIDYNLGLPDRAVATLNTIKEPPVAAKVAHAVQFMTTANYNALLSYSQANLARDNDPIWRSGIAMAATMAGRYDLAREQLLVIQPELFQPAPVVEPALANDSIGAALVMDRLGDKAQARRVAQALLASTEPRPGKRQSDSRRIARVKAYALLGDNARALAELRAAIDNGYRTLVDLDAFQRLDRYPMLDGLRGDPRFQAMIREVEADNARMRKAVLDAGG